MSATKQTTLLGTVLFFLMAIPAVQQAAENSRSRSNLNALQNRIALLEKKPRVLPQNKNAIPPSRASAKTVGDILKAQGSDLEAVSFLEQFSTAMMSQDVLEITRLLLPIMALEGEQSAQFLEEVAACDGHAFIKPTALNIIGQLAPSEDPGQTLERMMALNLKPSQYSRKLRQWATEDPEAALTWFVENRSSETLLGKGGASDPIKTLFADLLSGVAEKDPARALDIYFAETDLELRQEVVHGLSRVLSLGGPGEAQLHRLLEREDNEKVRTLIVRDVLRTLAESGGSFDDGLVLAKQYLNASEQPRALSSMVALNEKHSFGESANWLTEHLPVEAQEQAIKRLVGYRREVLELSEVEDWISRQEPGRLRDQGLRELTNLLSDRKSYQLSYQRAGEIKDLEMRGKAQTTIASQWLKEDESEARRHLPTELIEKVSH